MSELKNIFPANFKLIVDSGKGYKYNFGRINDFSAKTVQGDKVIAETVEPLDYKKSQFIQNDYGGVNEYESLGDLVCVDLNVAEYDDFVGSDYFDKEGFVILDKDLNVAYKSNENDYRRANKVNNKTAMLKLVYNYGPCALAHLHYSVMEDAKFKELLGAILDRRAEKIQDNPEQIKAEVEQVKQILKHFENEKTSHEAFYRGL
ncbi:MAG: hypothetical protein IJX17_02005 [Clostridia bacterium]|nr:hypothetical protein [Clostridia bacterium]